MTLGPDTSESNAGDPGSRQTLPTATAKVLDWEGLLHRCMCNLDLAQRVLEKFQQRFPDELAELESAFERGDLAQVARVAHRVRGSSATVSAEGLAQAASEVEDAGRAARAADVPACIERLRSEWSKLLELPRDIVVADGRPE